MLHSPAALLRDLTLGISFSGLFIEQGGENATLFFKKREPNRIKTANFNGTTNASPYLKCLLHVKGLFFKLVFSVILYLLEKRPSNYFPADR